MPRYRVIMTASTEATVEVTASSIDEAVSTVESTFDVDGQVLQFSDFEVYGAVGLDTSESLGESVDVV